MRLGSHKQPCLFSCIYLLKPGHTARRVRLLSASENRRFLRAIATLLHENAQKKNQNLAPYQQAKLASAPEQKKRREQPEWRKNRRIFRATAGVKRSSPDAGGSPPLSGYVTALLRIPPAPPPRLGPPGFPEYIISSHRISSYLVFHGAGRKVEPQLWLPLRRRRPHLRPSRGSGSICQLSSICSLQFCSQTCRDDSQMAAL